MNALSWGLVVLVFAAYGFGGLAGYIQGKREGYRRGWRDSLEGDSARQMQSFEAGRNLGRVEGES